MSERLLKLADRIRNEVDVLRLVLARAQEGWRRGQLSGDDYYLDGVALNLHGFYAGVERIFELIAGTVDGSVPQGANWHQTLLQQMASEVPRVRPAVISEATRDALDMYRGFRRRQTTLTARPLSLDPRPVVHRPWSIVHLRTSACPESGEG